MEGRPDKPKPGGDEEENAGLSERRRAAAAAFTKPQPSFAEWRAARDREDAAELKARDKAEAGVSSAGTRVASAEPPQPPAGPPSPPAGPPRPPAESSEDKRRRRARFWALLTFLIVLPIALALVLSPLLHHWREVDDNPFERRNETTVVTKVTVGRSPSKKVTVTRAPGNPPKKTTANETTTTGRTRETTTTVGPAKDALFVTALGNSGLLLVRIGIALLTAWIAAAAVQRAILGRFGVKVGPIDIAELPEVAAKSLDALNDCVEALESKVKKLEERAKTGWEPEEAIVWGAEVTRLDAEIDESKDRARYWTSRLRSSDWGRGSSSDW